MRVPARKTVQLGELIATVFDKAALYSSDPAEVSRLATRAVAHMLRQAKRSPVPV